MGILVALLSIFIILILCCFFFGKKSYFLRNKSKYSIANMFPFELNYKSKFMNNAVFNFSLILCGIICINFLLFARNIFLLNVPISILESIIGIVISFISVSIFFVPFNYLKTQVVLTIFLFAFTFIFSGGLIFEVINKYQVIDSPFAIIIIVLASISTLFCFGIIMNPKLSFTFKAKKEIDNEGNEFFSRPKVIPLAISQWLILFTFIFDIIIQFLICL